MVLSSCFFEGVSSSMVLHQFISGVLMLYICFNVKGCQKKYFALIEISYSNGVHSFSLFFWLSTQVLTLYQLF